MTALRRVVPVSPSGIVLLVFTVVFMLPVVHALSRSVSPPGGINNYLQVFQDERLPRYFLNSLIVSAGVIILTVFSASLAGFAFSKLQFPLKNVLFYTLLATLLVPFSTLIIPLFLLVRALGLHNTHLGLILPQAAFAVPFFTVLVRNYFNSLPNELLDAAHIDGCSDFGAFWRILMPLSLPVQAIVITLVFLSSWNNYLLPLLLLREQEMYTVPIAAVSYAFDANSLSQFGVVSFDSLFAALFILAIPTILIFLLLQRVFIGSVTAGALRT